MKQEAKLVYLLECLQKTAPPVLVFAEKTADVDDIHEYLLVKGFDYYTPARPLQGAGSTAGADSSSTLSACGVRDGLLHGTQPLLGLM